MEKQIKIDNEVETVWKSHHGDNLHYSEDQFNYRDHLDYDSGGVTESDVDQDVDLYRANDGKIFDNFDEAEKYNKTLTHRQKLSDLMNEIIILSKQVPDDAYLSDVAQVLREIDSTRGAHNILAKWYDSTCWG